MLGPGFRAERPLPVNSTDDAPGSGAKTTASNVSEALYELVCRYLGPEGKLRRDGGGASDQDGHVEQTYQYCMRILSSRMASNTVQDETHLSDMIKKRLMRRDKTSTSAIQFSNLYNKLASQDVLHNKWAVLAFLMAVGGQGESGGEDVLVDTPFSNFALRKLPQTSFTPQPNSIPNAYQTPKETEDRGPVPTKPYNSYYTAKYHKAQSSISESMLLRDVIYVFQGIDGKYVKYDASADSFLVNVETGVPRSLREIIRRLAEAGWLYRRISAFVEKAKSETGAGLIGQSFCSALNAELTDYYRLIAVLESQITRDGKSVEEFAAKGMSLKRLSVWTMEPLHRLRMMSVLIDLCKGEKGGSLITAVHNYVHHGDPFVQMFIHRLLSEISKPFYEMLRRWIYEGELEDPYDEFFVAVDSKAGDENLWRVKYSVRWDMVPSFLGRDVAKKIFLIGKSLNFLRHSCKTTPTQPFTLSSPKAFTYNQDDGKYLEEEIEKRYKAVSKELLEVLFKKFGVMKHLVGVKGYLLLGRGDFVGVLMDELGDALNKPANTIYRHNLTAVLETAIRSSNANWDDPDVVGRLDVRLLEASQGDTGWDIFALDYHVSEPLNTIFTPQVMHGYLKLFTFLWRLKRVEHCLGVGWKGRMRRVLEWRKGVPEISKLLQESQILWNEMNHFVMQLQYYILFEVVEISWEELSHFLFKGREEGTLDLDGVIGAHNRYLNSVTGRGTLGGVEGEDDVFKKVLKIFDTVLAFRECQEGLYWWAEREVRRR
ncbi:Gamma-tubulin complex component 3, partial [Rhizophlyctis rosea]